MLDKNNVLDILPLLPLQSIMLNNSIICRDTKLYKEINCFTLEKHIDVEIIRIAWNYVIQNNEVLRTVFRWKNLSQPVQVIMKKKQVDFTYKECADLDDDSFNMYIDELCDDILQLKMNLEDSLFNVTLLKKSDMYAVLIVVNHHILFDGWSSAIMMSEFVEYYSCLVDRIPYKTIKKEVYSNCVNYIDSKKQNFNKLFWKEYLAKGMLEAENLQVRNNLSKIKSKKINNYIVSDDILFRIKESAYKNKVTVAAYFYLSWAILMNILFQKENIVFGITFSGRPESMTNCMSLLINTFPLIININNDQKVICKLLEVKDIINTLQDNRTDSLMEVYQYYKELKVIQYDTIIVLQNYPVDSEISQNRVMPIHIRKRYYKSAIDLNLSVQFFETMQYEFEYNIERYSYSDIDYYAYLYKIILENINSCETISELKKMISDLDKKTSLMDIREFDF